MTIFHGPSAPANVALRELARIGRDPGCDLVIDDPATSRQHAIVRVEGDRVVLEDLGSSNGTYVDGQRVRRLAVLRDGAIVRVARTLIRVAPRTEPWAPPERTEDQGMALVGGSAIAAMRRQLSLAGPSALGVLILGESGTGKDVAARLVHAASGRKGPFIPVNCAVLSEDHVESELFGDAGDPATGAPPRGGLLSAAHGGTLFLDEVGDLPPAAQTKLLRALEERVVRPVGGGEGHPIDVRVISATTRDLASRVHSGEFCTALLMRLAAIEVALPPLRERPEDLPALVAHLLARAGARGCKVELEAMEALAIYEWPMNVRELDSVLRHALLAGEGAITLSSLRARFDVTRDMPLVPGGGNTPRPTGDALRAVIEEALRHHRGNIRRVCAEIGLSRTHAYRLLKRWGLDVEDYRDRASDDAAAGAQS
jgi:DNA-binding NtrC family response regulator